MDDCPTSLNNFISNANQTTECFKTPGDAPNKCNVHVGHEQIVPDGMSKSSFV